MPRFGLPANNYMPNVVQTKTAAYTALASELVLANASSSGFAVTLPSVPVVGTLVTVQKTDSSVNHVTVQPSGSGNVNGEANIVLTNQSSTAVFEHQGSDVWVVVGSYGLGPTPPSIDVQTATTYTTTLLDSNRRVTRNNASASTHTIPPNSSVAYRIGTELRVLNIGAGAVTVTPGAGVTINPAAITTLVLAQYEEAVLVKIGTDTWVSRVHNTIAASTTQRGLMEAAVASEALTGTASTLAVTPLALMSVRTPASLSTKTTTYTAVAGDWILADASGGGFTINLPSSPGNGALVTIQKIDSSANLVTLDPASTGTIHGASTYTLGQQWFGVTLEHQGSNVWSVVATSGTRATQEVIMVALSDESTAITTGVAKVTMRMPFAMVLTAVRASLTVASSSGTPTVDINEGGSTILSTKLTIDASELTSTTAATAAVISDANLADDAEITFDIDVAGTGAKGLKVALIGMRV